MSRTLIILLFFLFIGSADGQLNFSSAIFPVTGDSILVQKDLAFANINMAPGENKVWDLRKLESPLCQTIHFKSSYYYKTIEQAGNTFESKSGRINKIYFKGKKGLEEIGFLYEPKDNDRIRKPVYYDKSILIGSESLSYGESAYNRVRFEFEISRNELPENLQRDIPPSINEIRIKGTKTINRKTDAWGKLYLPDEKMVANRVLVSEFTTIQLFDIKSGKRIPYFDMKRIQQIYPDISTKNYYEFYSDNFKDKSAVISIDPNGHIQEISYQVKSNPENSIDLNSRNSDFILYPNPTYNIAKVYISDSYLGKHSLAIYNIIGKKLWERNIELEGETIIKENFGFLPKGTYLVSLLDENGNILRTTRLIIISV